ncbi:MAG: hypothetical protein ABIS86_02040 [Streptosporangiaceae bacterium]
MKLFARHRLITVMILMASAIRVVAMLATRSAKLFHSDSYEYLNLAVRLVPSPGFRPSGYPFLLALLRPFHSLQVVVGVQHVLGLVTGLLIYALLRRRSLPTWGAALAAAPVLFDVQFLWREHNILAETQFIFLIVAAVAVLLWSPQLTWRAAAVAGALLAFATITRTVAMPLLALVVFYLLVRRVPWRTVATLSVAGLLPLLAYASWYDHHNGEFSLSGADGIALWARTMTFADCKVIKPSADEARLCPQGERFELASEYVWATYSPLYFPGGLSDSTNNQTARSFAVHAITAQPLDYLNAVTQETLLAFTWFPYTPSGWHSSTDLFPEATENPLTGQPLVDRVRREYATDAGELRPVEPYTGYLSSYQRVMVLPGPLLALLLLVGSWGLLRRRPGTGLMLAFALVLFVVPVATLGFDHRYVLPVIPIACLAAALALARPQPTQPLEAVESPHHRVAELEYLSCQAALVPESPIR